MARKPSAKQAPIDPVPAVIAATMRLATERAWSDIPLADIAAAASLSLIELYRLFPSKLAILDALARQVDAAVLAAPADAADSPRDRLFDVLMRRFDALLPSRDGLRRLTRDVRRLRLEALPAAFALPRSMGWMLEAAGIPATGLRGALRARVLGAAYVSAFRAFLDDDSADLTRTMAALDRALRRVEPLLALPQTAGDGTAVADDAAPQQAP
ncbi:MAG: TetR family transcriptional regulator [Aliidongia sp.]